MEDAHRLTDKREVVKKDKSVVLNIKTHKKRVDPYKIISNFLNAVNSNYSLTKINLFSMLLCFL
jgi:hypothetical protein